MKAVLRPIVLPLRHIGSIVWLGINTFLETSDAVLHGRSPFRAALFFEQTDRTGVGSVPLIAMVSFFLGLTMALLTGYELRKFGTVNLVPGLVAVGFSRELGPLMTGIIMAARIGAAFTAELGTMVVNDEVEAIEAMGIGPLRFLLTPRVLSVLLLMPCLNVVSNLAALLGAAVVCNMKFSIALAYFNDLVIHDLIERDVISGSIKSLLFGLIIGLISCYKGLAATGGASGVGNATTSSVVTAITVVIAADTIFNIGMVAIYG